MDECAVTVIMAAWNAAAHIDEAIQSVLNQTCRDFELLVIDDASSDSTADIVRGYRDPRVRLVSLQTNVGPSAARNLGLRDARTEYVATLDSDDIACAERLERQLAYMTEHPECSVLGSAFDFIDDAGVRQGTFRPPTSSAVVKWRLLTENVVGNSTVMMRRSDALEAGGYDESLQVAEDYALWTALASTSEVANLADVLVLYRRNSTGLTATQYDRMTEATALVSRRALSAASGRDVTLDAVRCLQGTAPPSGRRRQACREAAGILCASLERLIGRDQPVRRALPVVLDEVQGQMAALCSTEPGATLVAAAQFSRLLFRVQGVRALSPSAVSRLLRLVVAGLRAGFSVRRSVPTPEGRTS